MSGKLSRRILTKCCHDLLDLLKSLDTLHGNCLNGILIVTELLIHIDHCIPESLALCLIVSSSFAKCHGSNNGILVSCIGSDKAAVALLKSEKICTLATVLKSEDLLSDVFESGKYFDKIHVVSLGNGICQVCCNDSLYKSSVLRKASVYSLSLAQLIVCKKASGHVTGKIMVLSVFILYADAKTVCIRVCGKYDVCIHFLRKLQAKLKCLCCLRVRIADCREIPVRKLLLRYYIYILKSKLFKDPSGRDIAGSVKRCVNDLQIPALCLDRIHMDDLFLKLCHVSIIDSLSDHFEKSCLYCVFLVHGLYGIPVGDCLYLAHDTGIMRWCDLRAVLPVNLVSVVFRRIVAGCYVDTCHTAQMTYCKGKLRCRTKCLKDISLDPVCCQAKCCFLGKLR